MKPDKKANRKYRDSVFRHLFNNEHASLELLNAIENTNYTDISMITINTVRDVFFAVAQNDVSFNFKKKVVILIEHQSTINENIPVRFMAEDIRKEIGIRNLPGFKDSKIFLFIDGALSFGEFIFIYIIHKKFGERLAEVSAIKALYFDIEKGLYENDERYYCILLLDRSREIGIKFEFLSFNLEDTQKEFLEIETIYNTKRDLEIKKKRKSDLIKTIILIPVAIVSLILCFFTNGWFLSIFSAIFSLSALYICQLKRILGK
ncbi:MAG: hypothetical protein FWF73_04200 [Spirochaetes bacterium]|nr:hypothetical protein [Spirochaetota bacterium]